MKKILFLAQLIPNKMGTMEEFVLLLSQELKKRGHKCHLGFAAMPPDNIKQLFHTTDAIIHITNVSEKTLIKKLKVAYNLFKIIKDNDIDVVHTNFFGLTAIPMLGIYLGRAKIVFTDHSSGKTYAKPWLRNNLAKALHFFIKLRTFKYIAVSNFVKKRMKETHYVNEEQCITIYNGINIERFKRTNKIDSRLVTEGNKNQHTLLAVASHIPEKGLQILIKAISLLKEKSADVHINAMFVGDGWYSMELEKLVLERNVSKEIQFLGRRSDVHTLIEKADIVVVPSLWDEAFGLIVAEAMASGTPVIASRIGGIPELIENDVSGYLFEPGNAEELALKIINLLNDRQKQIELSAAALEKVKMQFDIYDQIKAIIKIYESA